jgi:hypothetical protein
MRTLAIQKNLRVVTCFGCQSFELHVLPHCLSLQRQAWGHIAFEKRLTEMPRSGLIGGYMGLHGRVAQLVEQGIENPRVGGSIPSPATM